MQIKDISIQRAILILCIMAQETISAVSDQHAAPNDQLGPKSDHMTVYQSPLEDGSGGDLSRNIYH